DNKELFILAGLCNHVKKHHAAAVPLYRDALADPKVGRNLALQAHYHAACAAACAAAGKGKDADKLDAKERAALRQQALEWLRTELSGWGKLSAANPAPAVKALEQWQRAPELAEVRDEEALADLSAAERDAWRKLWADVDALLTKVRAAG